MAPRQEQQGGTMSDLVPRERAHFRELQVQLRQLQAGGTNASVLQCLANMCREEEEIFDRQTFLQKQKPPPEQKKKHGMKVEAWRRRFIRRSSMNSKLDDTDPDANLFTKYVKRKYRNGCGKTEDDRPFTFSENIQDILFKMTSQFGTDINDAYKSDPTQVMATGDNNPQDAIRKMQEIDENMAAIDEDMKILQKTKVAGMAKAANVFQGFKQLGKDDCLIDGSRSSSDGSSSEESSDGSDSGSGSDSSSEESDSEDSGSEEDSEEDESDWDGDSDDESSIDSDFMAEMENELGFDAAVEDDVSVDVSLMKAVASGKRAAGPRRPSERLLAIQGPSDSKVPEPISPLGASLNFIHSRDLPLPPLSPLSKPPCHNAPTQGTSIDADCESDDPNSDSSGSELDVDSDSNSESESEIDSDDEDKNDKADATKAESALAPSIAADQAGQSSQHGDQTAASAGLMSEALLHQMNAMLDGSNSESDSECDSEDDEDSEDNEDSEDDEDGDTTPKSESGGPTAQDLYAATAPHATAKPPEPSAVSVPLLADGGKDESAGDKNPEENDESDDGSDDESDDGESDDSESEYDSDDSSLDEEYLAQFATTLEAGSPKEVPPQTQAPSTIHAQPVATSQPPPTGLPGGAADLMALLSANIAPPTDQKKNVSSPTNPNGTSELSSTSSKRKVLLPHATGVGANVGAFDATGKPNKRALRHASSSLEDTYSQPQQCDVLSNLCIAARLAAIADEKVAPFNIGDRDTTAAAVDEELSLLESFDSDEEDPSSDPNSFLVSFSDFKRSSSLSKEEEETPRKIKFSLKGSRMGRSIRSVRSLLSKSGKEDAGKDEEADITSGQWGMAEKALSRSALCVDGEYTIMHARVPRRERVHSDDGLICNWNSIQDWSDSEDEAVKSEPDPEPTPIVSSWKPRRPSRRRSSRKSSTQQASLFRLSSHSSASKPLAVTLKEDSILEAAQIVAREFNSMDVSDHDKNRLAENPKIADDSRDHDASGKNTTRSLKSKMLLPKERPVSRRFTFSHLFHFGSMDAGYALHAAMQDDRLKIHYEPANKESAICPILGREGQKAPQRRATSPAARSRFANVNDESDLNVLPAASPSKEQATLLPLTSEKEKLSVLPPPSTSECRNHPRAPRMASGRSNSSKRHCSQKSLPSSPLRESTLPDHPTSSPVQDVLKSAPSSPSREQIVNLFSAPLASQSTPRRLSCYPSSEEDDHVSLPAPKFLPTPSESLLPDSSTSSQVQDVLKSPTPSRERTVNLFAAPFASQSTPRRLSCDSLSDEDDHVSLPAPKFLPPPPKASDNDANAPNKFIFPKIDFDSKKKGGKRRGGKKGREDQSQYTRRRHKKREADLRAKLQDEKQYIEGLMLVNRTQGKTVGGMVKSQM